MVRRSLEKKRAPFLANGEKAVVGDHAVFGTNASSSEVPVALQDLNGVDERELTWWKRVSTRRFALAR